MGKEIDKSTKGIKCWFRLGKLYSSILKIYIRWYMLHLLLRTRQVYLWMWLNRHNQNLEVVAFLRIFLCVKGRCLYSSRVSMYIYLIFSQGRLCWHYASTGVWIKRFCTKRLSANPFAKPDVLYWSLLQNMPPYGIIWSNMQRDSLQPSRNILP